MVLGSAGPQPESRGGDGDRQRGREGCGCLCPAGRDGRGTGAAKKLPGRCCRLPALQAAWQTPSAPLHPGAKRLPWHARGGRQPLLLEGGDAPSTPSAP